MNKVILNEESIISISDLHKELKEQLGLPDYYGENLDALWDCLTSWVNMPLVIEWKHVEKSRVYLGDQASAYLQLFREAEEELDGFQFKTDESSQQTAGLSAARSCSICRNERALEQYARLFLRNSDRLFVVPLLSIKLAADRSESADSVKKRLVKNSDKFPVFHLFFRDTAFRMFCEVVF